ncbi:LPS export ABC transporter periplasmic protein LptC [Ancylobacter oerskovii]|uniref:LPS export ABC transporter periplasmic protein LptC n=1 Tax=Ancylobacter oerskovii TaxID=459519 RepID=A0ABW4YTJ3_9HYPH|nr:LPS export ABC transporter periplasmic protein LptC [Ancylobacter oerskovii]MBS7543420.1 LPS export ABC transporter periplasmic protein LptC [Ancylobacter oerskovii]
MNRQITSAEQSASGPGSAASARRVAAASQRFRDAARHSRWVRLFKRGTPVAVVLGLATIGGFVWLDPFRIPVDLPVELGRASLSGSRIKMELPKLSGFTEDNRGYNLTAEAASQDLTQPNRIDLEVIHARIELAEQGWAKLTAKVGSYDTKTQDITLGEGVEFSTNAGYAGKLQEASVSMRDGRLVSEHPVELTYTDARLTADRMEVTQKDARALFTGNVSLVFKLPPENKAELKTGTTAVALDPASAAPSTRAIP